MGLFYYLRSGYAKKESVHLMCYNSLLELIITREQELSMALFGRKKKDEEKGAKSSENKQSNSVTGEMKVILEAREEEQKEKLAKAEERQQAQEEQAKQESFLEEQSKQAAKKILEGDGIPEGMTFFVVCDEIPLSAEPETEGNIVVRGTIRGTLKAGAEVFLYQGRGDKFTVKVEKIRNENREFVDEISYDRAEIEITRGDIPLPENPDDNASSAVQRFAVLTDGKGIEDMKDPSCKGMANAGNPRTTAMLCEYGKFGKDPVFFGTVMDSLMTSEFVTIAKISPAQNGKSAIGFVGITTKQDPNSSYLPVFTSQALAQRALKNGFGKQGGPDKRLCLSFAQTAAISRDNHHQGFLVNPGGPVTITIHKELVDKMVGTTIFKERFGEGAGDNASLALGGTGNRDLDNFIGKGGPNMPGIQKVIVSNPSDTPEFAVIENAVKSYCGKHADIVKVLILVSTPANNRKDRSYLCIMDCPDETFETECKGLAEAIKPFLKGIRRIQFQQFSKINKEKFPSKVTWLYSKLPQ